MPRILYFMRPSFFFHDYEEESHPASNWTQRIAGGSTDLVYLAKLSHCEKPFRISHIHTFCFSIDSHCLLLDDRSFCITKIRPLTYAAALEGLLGGTASTTRRCVQHLFDSREGIVGLATATSGFRKSAFTLRVLIESSDMGPMAKAVH